MANEGQRFVLEIDTLIKLNTGDVVAKVRSMFNDLRAEGQRAIASGSQAGIAHLPGLYAGNLGITSALAGAKPGITDTQRAQLEAVQRRAEADYRRLQASTGPTQNLPNLGNLGVAQQRGSLLLQEALTRQSNAKLREAEAADKLAAAERRAATETERAAILAAGRGDTPTGKYGPPVPSPGSKYDPLPRLGPPVPVPGQTYGAERATLEATRALQIKGDIAREQATSKSYLEAKARATLAERERAVAINKATRAEAIALGQGGGTFFQRLQAQVHTRGGFGGGVGGGGDTRLPQDFQSFGQFLTSKAVTTGGFALSGAVLYGTISGFKQITQEASLLQRELAIVKGQFESLGDNAGFERFSKQVVDISVQTGIAANEVALVARQLAGVFRDPTTGAADFTKALQETAVALKLSQVTGLPFQEITDSMTAITTTLGTSFTTIGDLAIGLEQRFGVLAPQIIQFTADVAPVAQALGFTVEQISALGAIAQQRSGVSGGALAESFNRALPAIQQAGVKIADIFNQRPDTAKFTTSVLGALGQGQGAAAIQELAKAYAVMTNNQRQALGELLGGPRAAKAFFAVLEAGTDTIDALNGKTGQYAGSLDQRFKDFQSTVSFAFERARRALEQFGLALFNSGLADGLKAVADSGALVAQMAAQLLKLFGELNDSLGGLPVKLGAIYLGFRLLGAVGGGLGGIGLLAGGLRSGGTTGGPQFASPYNAAAFAGGGASAPSARPRFVPVTGAGLAIEKAGLGTGAKAALGGVVESLAPLIAAYAVTQFAQTVSTVNAQIQQAQKSLTDQVQAQLGKKVSPDELLKRASSVDDSQTFTRLGLGIPNIAGDVLLKVLSFGTVDTTSPYDKALDAIQIANSARQIKELEAIAKTLNDKDRKQLEAVIARFKADPANNQINDAVARIIAAKTNDPAVAGALSDIAREFAQTAQPVGQNKVNDYAPVLDEVQASYDRGDASLAQLLAAEKAQLANWQQALAAAGDNQQARLEAAKGLIAEQKKNDQIIDTAAKRAADITVKMAGLRGDNVVNATADAALNTLRAKISQGASQDDILTASLDALAAQQAQLTQFINSPVVINGIARAPTSAEKLARAVQGIPISPELRAAVIKARLSTDAAVKAGLVAANTQTSFGTDDLISQITQALIDSGKAEVDFLTAAIDKKIVEITNTLQSAGVLSGSGEQQLRQALSDLQAARSALQNLPSIDPGTKVTQDVTDLTNQAAIDASTEAKALADALIAQQRAQAHGDPIAEAQAAIAAAQNAIRYAGTPSERAAAVAQLIDAQNQLEDAQLAVLQSSVSLAEASTSDPVSKARLALQKAQTAVANAHGVAAQNDALAQQVEAQRTLNEAIADVFRSQQELVGALADAAGDTVASARAQLEVARQNLKDLLARQAAGDDPGEGAINRARAQVAQSDAAVRDAQLRKGSSDIDIALQLERITTQQAIAQFQALLQIPNLTVDQTNEILLKIKQLKNDLSNNLQFDIPSEIKLPTIYQVRRLGPGAGDTTPSGPGSYQDNRVISLFQGAVINASDPTHVQSAVDAIVEAIGAPPRNGPRVGAVH